MTSQSGSITSLDVLAKRSIEVEFIGKKDTPYRERFIYFYHDSGSNLLRCKGFRQFKLVGRERAVLSIRALDDQLIYENPAVLHRYIDGKLSPEQCVELMQQGRWYVSMHAKRPSELR